jgi:hypothetical protein
MCFNYKVSLLTFTVGTIFSILLMIYGNPVYRLENKASGLFLIFISLIQFMDFLLWIDIDNKIGINKLTTIGGPILNVCQPTILYLIKLFYYKPNILSLQNYNLPVAVLNIAYFIYFITVYVRFLLKDKLVTSTQDGHLKWPWLKYTNPYPYLVLFAINIFYLFNFTYSLVLFSVLYFFLYISKKYFKYSAGELWCFFGAFVPLIMFFLSFHIDKLDNLWNYISY